MWRRRVQLARIARDNNEAATARSVERGARAVGVDEFTVVDGGADDVAGATRGYDHEVAAEAAGQVFDGQPRQARAVTEVYDVTDQRRGTAQGGAGAGTEA